MIHDASVEVTCDGCGESVFLSPPYVYTSLAATGSHYDCSDSTLEKLLKKEGWYVEGKAQFCENCRTKERETRMAKELADGFTDAHLYLVEGLTPTKERLERDVNTLAKFNEMESTGHREG